jgi:aromatase
MSGHTDNAILIDAPIDYVWQQTNDIASWPSLFTEYAAAEVLEQEGDTVTFRLTMHPDADGNAWSWVSRRVADKNTWTVRAQRLETGWFSHMDLLWTYEALGMDRTMLRWVQDFDMKPDSPVGLAAMTERINTNSPVQLQAIKDKLERRRKRVVRLSDIPAVTHRGGELHPMLTPATVGSGSGFCGVVRLAPGEVLSEHYHPYSEEFLYLTQGELRVDLDGEPHQLGAESGLLVPRTVRHRITNTGLVPAVAVFQLAPLAPRPELGHVETEPRPASRTGATEAVTA